MDLATRKIHFIQGFLKLESEKTIAQLEKLLQEETKPSSEFQPMTMDAFETRINDAAKDVANGRLTENNKLIVEIEQWR